MKPSFLLPAFLCLALNSYSQDRPDIRAYSLGDTLPSQLRVTEKNFILDFFLTRCVSCIRNLQELDDLQAKYKQALKIVVVTTEDSAKVANTLSKIPSLKHLRLTFITDDTIYYRLFPFRLVPHEVWVSNQGRVEAITSDFQVNSANIEQFIAGKLPPLAVKKDILDYDHGKPLFTENNGGDPPPYFINSIFTEAIDGLGGASSIRPENGRIRWTFINTPLWILYSNALGFDNNRFFNQLSKAALAYKLFSYQLIVPGDMPRTQIIQLMVTDLNRYLGIRGRIEARTVNCLALIKKNKGAQISYATELEEMITGTDSSIIFKNSNISSIVKYLNSVNPPSAGLNVIMDDTGIKRLINLSLPLLEFPDLQKLNKALGDAGLALVQTKRRLPVFVLSD